jgi:hypothetical protein
MEPRIRTERPPRIAADERGAMMVMGVFVSMFLVGALWSIAGMGEAVVMRERMQEAADASAMAAAVIDARAMNILVLFNLIMAAILSIRVLLNAIIIGAAFVAFASGLLTGIPIIGQAIFLPLMLSAIALGVVVGAIKGEVNPAITQSLTDFDNAMNGIAQVTPSLASGAGGIPAMYSPPLAQSQPTAAVGAPTQTSTLPLPVRFGPADSLCDPHALDALGFEVDNIMNQSLHSSVIGLAKHPIDLAIAAVTPIVEANGWLADSLCELGGTNQVGVSGPISNISQQCIQSAQASTPCTNSAPGGPDQQALSSAEQLEPDGGPLTDQAQSALTTDTGNCTDEQDQCNSGTNKAQQQATPPPIQVSPTQATAQPMVVPHFMFNGSALAQIYSRILMDASSAQEPMLGLAPSLVSIASRKQVIPNTPPTGYNSASAQAEFFYDCTGRWSTCIDKSMWNYYWRARLRRLSLTQLMDETGPVEFSQCQEIVALGGTCSLTGTTDPIREQVGNELFDEQNDAMTRLFNQLQANPTPLGNNFQSDVLAHEPQDLDILVVH